ncbi:unnamed protein product [Lactuca virosa]|uniref:Uncharacterized protein n=1 Tax=Lactuca virosa TaxID=75947 RepID=A0AAU9N7Q0_9ASTR|nr:unnamed protein product [Lactuca virosa]
MESIINCQHPSTLRFAVHFFSCVVHSRFHLATDESPSHRHLLSPLPSPAPSPAVATLTAGNSSRIHNRAKLAGGSNLSISVKEVL